MKKAAKQFLLILVALVMLLETAPLSALAEELPAAQGKIISTDVSEGRQVGIEPEKLHVLKEGEYTVAPVADPSALVELINSQEQPAQPARGGMRMLKSARPAPAALHASGFLAYDIELTDSAANALAYEVTVPVGVDMLKDYRDAYLPLKITEVSYQLHHIHTKEDGEVTAEKIEGDVTDKDGVINDFTITVGSFSSFVLQYTVDFAFEADGQSYELSLAGGDCVTLGALAAALGIVPGEKAQAFTRDVAEATFSTPELAYVGQVDTDTTLGAFKEALGLVCEYSAELTKADIEAINSRALTAGEWVLISLRPFTTPETLTLRMTLGEMFEISVTDAQIKKTVITESGEAYEITVTFDPEKTGIPEDADLEVQELLPETEGYSDYVAKTEEALGMEEGSAGYIRLFDIKIVNKDDPTIKYQPKEGTSVDVRIALADAESDSLNVVHFMDENDAGSLVDAATNGQIVSFAADGFSVYAIVDEDDTTPETKSIQYVFHYSDKAPFIFVNKNGDTTDTQFVKDGETLFYPGVPIDDPNQEGKEFWGWYEGTLNGDAIEWGEEAKFDTPISVDETKTVNLYARYEQTYYVTYYDEKGNVYSVVKHANGDTIYLDVTGTETVYTVSVAQKAFLGWSIKSNTTEEVAHNTMMTITGNVSLYPAINNVKWINFYGGETGSGASYTAPVYVLGDKVTADKKPEDPTRRGYAFQGWYKDQNYTQAFKWDGTEDIAGDITLYAKWVEANTKYTVVFWKQNVEGTGYDYVESSSRDALTGTTVSLRTTGNNGDTNRAGKTVNDESYEGFHYNNSASDESATVLANGTTVLNVYYDRNMHTFYFYTGSGSSSYIYLTTTSNSGTQYGYWNGSYQRIYYRNNAWRQTNRDNGVIYTGQRFTRTSVNGLIHSVNALYGSDISNIWNFTGTNGVTYPRDNPPTSWTPHGSSLYTARITRMEIMPDEDIYFSHTTSSNPTRYFHYYVEALPGAENTRTFNGMQYSLYTDLTHDFNRIYYEDDFWLIEGFTRQAIATANGTNVTNQIGYNTAWQSSWNSNLYFYYTRNSYDLEFRNSDDTSVVYATKSVKYQAPVANEIIADPTPPEGYVFHGWYADPSCNTRVFFSEPTEAELDELKYELNSEGRKTYKTDADLSIGGQDDYIVLETMPASNYPLYANWAPKRYQVNIDPNGGELLTDGTQATYFNLDYGEKIGEYANVNRNYIRISEGQDVTGKTRYSYHYDSRTDNDGEHRWAYYYEDPNGDYIEDTTAYTFVGWYHVANNGAGAVDRAPYNFDSIVEENTTLRAMWRREGVFKVKYTNIMNEGKEGEIASPDNKPADDQYTYVDLAEAKVGPSIAPPENYQFAGWRVLGTETPLYNPGDIFVIDSNFAEYEQDGTMFVTLEPVFIQIDDASITYDINVPAGSSAITDQLTDVDNNSQLNLKDNSSVTLSTGDGFAVKGYRLIGWSDQKLNPIEYPIVKNEDGSFSGTLPPDAHLFNLGGTYGVSDENTLYAVWSPNKIEFTKHVYVEGNLQLNQVNHTIYIALTKGDKETYVRDENNNILVKEIQIINGVPTPETVVFYGLEEGEYNVWELKDPTGSRLGVSDVFPITGADPAANFAVKSITGNNNATISEEQPTAETELTNTYAREDETPIKFEANKVWINRKAEVITPENMPENATATFSLFREINGNTDTTPVASITLNGEADAATTPFGTPNSVMGQPYYQEDEPWHATFGNLPRVDGSGNRIIYKVKETAATPDGFYPWKEKSANNELCGPDWYLTNSGGVIYNRKLTMTVQVQKHVDFQPNNGDEKAKTYEAFANDEDTKKKLTFTVTLPTGEEHLDLSQFHEYKDEHGSTTFLYEFYDVPYYIGLYPENDASCQLVMKEEGEQDLLKEYNYYIWHIEGYENGNTNWDISSGQPVPEEVIATRTVTQSIDANDPLVEIRIQNKYRRGSEGEFEKIKKTVIGLTEADFQSNLETFRNLHFVIQNEDGFYAGKKETPAWNPETKRYEKLEWVSEISNATVIAPDFIYSQKDDTWVAEVNLSDFNSFPSGTYTLVELEAREGGYEGKNAQIAGYTLEVTDNTVVVDTHENDTNWSESFRYTLSITNKYTRATGSVEFTKVNENNDGLEGAKFQLFSDAACKTPAKQADGTTDIRVAISDEDGKVTFANVPTGTYYMKETEAPEGYAVSSNVYQVVIVEEPESSTIKLYENDAATGEELSEIPNTPSNKYLRIKKVGDDSAGQSGLAGAEFSLKAAPPVVGFVDKETLTSMDGANLGYLPSGDTSDATLFTLPIGTYTLTETKVPLYYEGINGPVTITVTNTGITVNAMEGVSLSGPENNVYTLTITNTHTGSIKIRKTDDKANALTGAKFQLFSVDTETENETPFTTVDMSEVSEITINNIPSGNYKLVETNAPNGFMILPSGIEFTVNVNAGVTTIHLIEGQSASAEDGTITIINTPGVQLPSTGGMGTAPIYVAGTVLVLLALAMLLKKRRQRCD